MKGKIFNAQEVQAIIAGNKTIFREVIKKTEDEIENYSLPDRCGTELLLSECPYQVGQKIFCKESFWEYKRFGDEFRYDYDADTDYTKCLPDGFPIQRIPLGAWEVKKRPAQRMKQEHSRITLLIKEIRVERLAEISEKDCIKEGIEKMWLEENEYFPRHTFGKHSFFEVKKVFRDWWNSTHKKPEEKFEANPFVWVVDFKINK